MHYPQTPGSIQTWCIDAAAPDARGEFVRHADAVMAPCGLGGCA